MALLWHPVGSIEGLMNKPDMHSTSHSEGLQGRHCAPDIDLPAIHLHARGLHQDPEQDHSRNCREQVSCKAHLQTQN